MAAGAAINLVKTAGEELWSKLWSPAVERGAFQSGEAGLRRIGPLGGTLADMLKASQEKAEIRIGKVAEHYVSRAGEIEKSGLTNEFVNDLERKARATTPAVRDLADYSRLLNSALVPEAVGAGIKVGPLVGDDFHHMWDPEIFKGVNEEKIIKHLVATGQAANEGEASRVMNFMRSKGGKVHSLESPRRINLPGYRQDMAVMFDHFSNSIKRIEQAKVFGPKDQALDQLLSGIRQQHGASAFQYAQLVANNFLGRGAGYAPAGDLEGVVGHGLYKKLASLETVMHLGLAFLRHSGQFLNTTVVAARSGLTPTVRALRDAILDHGNANDFALRAGATLQSVSHDFRRIAGVESETIGGKVLRYTPFSYIDKLRRVFAARVGAAYTEQEFARFMKNPADAKAILNLRLMGLDPSEIQKAGGLQERHLLQAAKRMSDMTQFKSDALSLPPRWVGQKDPLLKLAVMYKQFFFHQARFVKDQVLKPALLEKEYKPLLYMATLFPTFGEMVADLNEVARKGNLKDRPDFDKQHWMDRLIDNYAAIGGFGIMADMVHSFAQPTETAAFRFVVGPVISDTIDIARIPFLKHPDEAIEKKIMQSIPTVGPILSKKVLPPKRKPAPGPLQRGMVTKEFNKLFGF